MKLWTIQTEEVYQLLLKEGRFCCDISKIKMPELREHYQWLVDQMQNRIGVPEKGIDFPIWAWHTYDGKRKKPDLRRERWGNGFAGDRFVCMEIEVPDENVLLSDFDLWSIILVNGLISYSREEDDRLETEFELMNNEEQEKFERKNWEKVFDIIHLDSEWITCGKWIQATFWELRAEQVKTVWHFVSAGSDRNARSKDIFE